MMHFGSSGIVGELSPRSSEMGYSAADGAVLVAAAVQVAIQAAAPLILLLRLQMAPVALKAREASSHAN